MSWTTTKPAKEGVYWAKTGSTYKILWLYDLGNGTHFWAAFGNPTMFTYNQVTADEWYGPLMPPPAAAIAPSGIMGPTTTQTAQHVETPADDAPKPIKWREFI